MYRKSLDMERNNVTEEGCDFISRVAGLPVVQTVVDSTKGIYNKAKESNELVKYTLNTAEKTVFVAAERAKPVMVKLERPIGLANNLACMTLAKLEETVPIIKSSPEEIIAETKKLYDETVVQPALARYNHAKNYGLQKATAVKDYSLAKANLLIDTKYGHMLVGTLDELVVKADSYMDSYLPPVKCDGQPDEPTMNKDANTLEKVTTLSKKVSQRMTCHAVIKLQAAKKHTDEILSNLHFTIDLMHMAKSNVDQTNKALMERLAQASDQIGQLWDKFNKGNPNEPGDKTLEQKLLFVASQLTEQLNKTYTKLASTLALLPNNLQPKVKMVHQYINNLYNQFAQAKSWDEISAVVVVQMKDATKNLKVLSSNIFDQILKISPISMLSTTDQEQPTTIQTTLVWKHVDIQMNDKMKREGELKKRYRLRVTECRFGWDSDVYLREIQLSRGIPNEVEFVSFISAVQTTGSDQSSSEEDTVELVLRSKCTSAL